MATGAQPGPALPPAWWQGWGEQPWFSCCHRWGCIGFPPPGCCLLWSSSSSLASKQRSITAGRSRCRFPEQLIRLPPDYAQPAAPRAAPETRRTRKAESQLSLLMPALKVGYIKPRGKKGELRGGCQQPAPRISSHRVPSSELAWLGSSRGVLPSPGLHSSHARCEQLKNCRRGAEQPPSTNTSKRWGG